MNTFAKIIRVEGFPGNRVNFYTIQVENRERNEFEDFLDRHVSNTAIYEQLSFLYKKLENFSLQGARRHFFRSEGSFHALPPPAKYLDVTFGRKQLRLYCLYISPCIVVLFNGGIKTKNKAQDCDNVSRYFAEAKEFTKKIDEMIRNREVFFDENRSEILNHENIEIWLT